MREGEANLDSAENHIARLKENQEKLLIELDAARARVRETSHVLTDLQVGLIIQTKLTFIFGSLGYLNSFRKFLSLLVYKVSKLYILKSTVKVMSARGRRPRITLRDPQLR